MSRAATVLREPLLWFTLIAAGCFGLWSLQEDVRQIEVSVRVVDQLLADFRTLNGRAPSVQERDALVQRWIDDEILFREALAEGLHLGDARIRHRLVDKMRFMLVEEPEPPSDAELVNYYAEHMDRYYTEPQISFVQRFFTAAPQAPDALLARLQAGDTVDADAFWLGERFTDYDLSMLRGLFGGPFTERLAALEIGRWAGPLVSELGVHFVRVDARRAPLLLGFARVREAVQADWLAARRAAQLSEALAPRRRSYEIVRPVEAVR